MRPSRLGVFFSLLYLVPTIGCIGMGLSSDDSKSWFVLLQLPIVLQQSAIDALGFRGNFSGISWPEAYLLLCAPVVAILYCAGWWLERLIKRGPKGEQPK